MKRFIVALFLLIATTASAYQASISVPNGTGAQVRTNMNNALQAITTHQSGTAAPATTYAYQAWVDTSTSPPTYKIRNGANTAWISVGTLNDSGSAFIASNSALLGGSPGSYYQPASTAITTSNIGSQSVAYATSAGSATTAANVSGANRIPWAAKPAFRGARCYPSSNITWGNGGGLQRGGGTVWSGESYDTDNIHEVGTNGNTLTVPSGVTKIRLRSRVTFSNNATGKRVAVLQKAGAPDPSYDAVSMPATTDWYTVINLDSGIISVVAGDTFYMAFEQTSGVDLQIMAGPLHTWLAMEIIE